VIRKLFDKAVFEWEIEKTGKLYAEGEITLEKEAMGAGISVRG